MIIASIDIGTNTVLLLIAKVNIAPFSIDPLLDEYRMPRIGKGLTSGSSINHDSISKLYEVLAEFKKIIAAYNCEHILVTATNALRVASNANVIKNEIKKLFDFDLDIIPGELEAKFAFLGAQSGSDETNNSLVIDIGGGSTELILGNYNEIIFMESFQIGSVSATENYLLSIPPVQIEFLKLKNELNSIFRKIKGMNKPEKVIAIAGTPTTLVSMQSGLRVFDEKVIENSILKKHELLSLIDRLSKLTPEKIRNQFGDVMRGREDIILAGAIILNFIMESMNIDDLTVSSRGIRHGAIINYIRKNQN